MGTWERSRVMLKTKGSAKMESERFHGWIQLKSSSGKERGFQGSQAVGNALSKEAYDRVPSIHLATFLGTYIMCYIANKWCSEL